MNGLLELADELREAARILDDMADNAAHGPESLRLRGKAAGVRLAVSKCEEVVRLRGVL